MRESGPVAGRASKGLAPAEGSTPSDARRPLPGPTITNSALTLAIFVVVCCACAALAISNLPVTW